MNEGAALLFLAILDRIGKKEQGSSHICIELDVR